MKEWISLEDVFESLNCSDIKYVILRNYEDILDFQSFNLHPDIDLLCDSAERLISILGAEPRNNHKDLVHAKINMDGKVIPIDIRSVGDSYYDNRWEKNILDTRVLSEYGFYIPNDENYFYSLCYHALFQKESCSEEYKNKLIEMKPEIKKMVDQGELINILEQYMIAHKYKYTIPRNYYGHLNVHIADKRLMSIITRIRLSVRSILSLTK